MNESNNQESIESYRFHHIDLNKCKVCKEFSCEEACMRGLYKIVNKDTKPICTIIDGREDFCVKCHMCTTACKARAITID